MRQAADAAKDKVKEEKPVDPVVAAMMGEFLSPIPHVLGASTNRRGRLGKRAPGVAAGVCLLPKSIGAQLRSSVVCSLPVSDPLGPGACAL